MIRNLMLSSGLALLVLAAAGCEILGLDGDVKVRVRNGSDQVLTDVSIFLPRNTLFFPELLPGEASAYAVVPKAYRIVTAEVVVGQDTARAQVIDYVGEDPLDPGRYTYVLRFFSGSPPSLGVDFEKES
ncbi:MAG: hypothetical protein KJN92_15015 [Gemmatimonadetes bacterium]|nr:hypothetical protein [Gemmatimonadota bacterium]